MKEVNSGEKKAKGSGGCGSRCGSMRRIAQGGNPMVNVTTPLPSL